MSGIELASLPNLVLFNFLDLILFLIIQTSEKLLIHVIYIAGLWPRNARDCSQHLLCSLSPCSLAPQVHDVPSSHFQSSVNKTTHSTSFFKKSSGSDELGAYQICFSFRFSETL